MKPALVVGAIIAATLAAYSNTLPGRFIYDDRPIIARNPLIRSLTQIPQLFRTSYWDGASGAPADVKGGLYRPLTMTTYSLNYAVGKLNPWGYHAVNLLLHIGVTLLFGFLCLRLGFSPFTSAAAALIFGVLPIHTEAVSNVVGRAELLAAFFVLISWIVLAKSSKATQIVVGVFCFILSLLSKENAAAFLPVLLISDYLTLKTSWKDLVRKRLVVWISLGGAIGLVFGWRLHILGHAADTGSLPYFVDQSLVQVYLTMARFMALHYLVPMVTGLGLCADYTRPALADASFHDPLAWVCGLAIAAAISSAGYRFLKHKNKVGFCALLFVVLLLPVLNIGIRLEVIGAERFLYLPSIGYCLALGLLLQQAIGKRILSDQMALVSLLGMAMWYGTWTFQRNQVWSSEERFWKQTQKDAPKSPRAWNGFGITLMQAGKYDEAQTFFHKAADLNPLLEDAYYNAGECYFLKGDLAASKRVFAAYLQVKPYDPGAKYYLKLIETKENEFRGKRKQPRLLKEDASVKKLS